VIPDDEASSPAGDGPPRSAPRRDGTPAPAEGAGPVAPLGRLVRHEAHRLLSEARLAPDPARVADGWERRFVADGSRCDEAMALYRQLGYEVCADPLAPEDLAGECEDCQLVMLLQFKTIYTRARRGGT
jgi:hypothetical protein